MHYRMSFLKIMRVTSMAYGRYFVYITIYGSFVYFLMTFSYSRNFLVRTLKCTNYIIVKITAITD